VNFPKKNHSVELRKLISFVANKPDYWFLSYEKEELGNQDCYRVLSEKLKQLSNNVPIEYVMGECFFFGTKYKVTNDVLIPRPETELLVEKALTTIEGNPKRSQKILELGTGSGAVILSILLNLTQNEKEIIATATDLSEAALRVAEENCRNHKKVIDFRLGDWWRSLKTTDGPFDVIIANPPYIGSSDQQYESSNLRFEPSVALYGKRKSMNGLSDIQKIIEHAEDWLTKDGKLLMEHGFKQGQLVEEIVSKSTRLSVLERFEDFGGLPRGVTLGFF
jgi:release factor glutamine methyltransferase